VDEFRNFLMSEEVDIIGYQIKHFNVLVEEYECHGPGAFQFALKT